MDADRVYVPIQDGLLLALARTTGVEIWRRGIPSLWPPVSHQGSLFVVASDYVYALDPATGLTRWQVPLARAAMAPAQAVGDLLVVPMVPDEVLAFRISDGERVWDRSLGGRAGPVSMAAGATGVYLSLPDARMAALDLADGRLRWERVLQGVLGVPALGRDRVFVGSNANTFHALDARNGSTKWTWGNRMIGGDVIGAAVDQDVVYFASLDNILRAVNASNGNQRWKQVIPARPILPPFAFGRLVAVAGVSPAVSTFNAKTGAALGTFVVPTTATAGAPGLLQEPPLFDVAPRPFQIGTVLITRDGRVLALRATDLMFRESAPVPLLTPPGRALVRERLP